jgi:hypothetical protein
MENINIKQVLDEDGIAYHENKKHFILETCPTCGKTDKLYIDKKKKLWICYACVGPGNAKEADFGKGNVYQLLLALGWDKERIRNKMKGSNSRPTGEMKFEPIKVEAPVVTDVRTFQPFSMPNRYIIMDRSKMQMNHFQEAYLYLWKRHFSTIYQYERWRPMYDPKAKRIVFPCRVLSGLVVGYQARDITDRHKKKHPRCPNNDCERKWWTYYKDEMIPPPECPSCGSQLREFMYPKTLNNSDLPKSEFFFGEDTVDWSQPVVLVEGPFDATNVKNSLALLGKSLSEDQLKLLINNAKEVVIYFDGDQPGRLAATGVYEQLRPFVNVQIVNTEEGSDPGDRTLDHNCVSVAEALDPQEWHAAVGLVAL